MTLSYGTGILFAQDNASVTDNLQAYKDYITKQIDANKALLDLTTFTANEEKGLEALDKTVTVCDEMLAAADIAPNDAAWALRRKAVALVALTRWSPVKYGRPLQSLVGELEQQKEVLKKSIDLVNATLNTQTIRDTIVRKHLKDLEATPTQQMKDEDFTAFAANVVDYVKRFHGTKDGPKSDETLKFVMKSIDRFPRTKRDILYKGICPEVSKVFTSSRDVKEQRYGRLLLGSQRRNELIGDIMALDGYTPEGKPFDEKQLKGKVVLVDFWATWCHPCMDSLPDMSTLYEKYKDEGFTIVGISADDSAARVASFVQKHTLPGGKKIDWHILSDQVSINKEEEPISEYYGVDEYPTYFLIGRDGKVVTTSVKPTAFEFQITEELKKQSGDKSIDPNRRSPL
jgi:thiol-disulfide isomerase/thioredoxin